MFLPVLVMNGTAATVAISYQARVFVCLVSMVQIIFFSETATVMLATKSPIKFWELLVCFLERTIVAIPMAAVVIPCFSDRSRKKWQEHNVKNHSSLFVEKYADRELFVFWKGNGR